MTLAVCLAAAIVYSIVLWLLAGRAARAREVELGRPPLGILALIVAGTLLVALSLPGAVRCGVGATLIGASIAAIFDARTGLIPDDLSLATAAAIAVAVLAAGDAVSALAGVVACGGALLALHLGTRRRGIGLGDVKLAAVLGFGLGPAHGLVAVGAAFVIGAAVAIVALALGRTSYASSIRFGPYLALGAGCAPVVTSWLSA